MAVSRGWVSFVSIILRGLLSVQALLLLVYVAGFNRMCEALRRPGMPRVLVTQLLMVYRYLTVLLQEGDLIVVAPEDAHKPRCQADGPEAVKKVVVKVAV